MIKGDADVSLLPSQPIVSLIGTYDISLEKYLARPLSPILTMNYRTKDSFSFVKDLKSVNS